MQHDPDRVGGHGERLGQFGRKDQMAVERKKEKARQQQRSEYFRTYPIAPRLMASLPLYPELFTIVGEFLAGENQFGTLANLNVANHLVREATNIVLWTTVVLDSKMPRWDIEGKLSAVDNHHAAPGLPANFKHVRYLLITIDDDFFERGVTDLFPNLRAVIETEGDTDTEGGLAITILQPVTHQCLFFQLASIPIRSSARDASPPPCSPVIVGIRLLSEGSGTLCGFGSFQTSGLDWYRHSPFRYGSFAFDWMTQPTLEGRNKSVGNAKRLVDTFFGLFELAGYAMSLEEPMSNRPGIPWPERSRSSTSCRLWSDQLGAVGEGFPRMAAECPDVLRLHPVLDVFDLASLEIMRETIRAFQRSYAKHPELLHGHVPFDRDTEVLIAIRCWTKNPISGKYLQAVLFVNLDDARKPSQLVAEFRWARIINGSHFMDERVWWSEVLHLDNSEPRRELIATNETR